ncbi:MAG: TAXI family TRAP transporter solute-binding subunit [Pseudomonadota bacterium]
MADTLRFDPLINVVRIGLRWAVLLIGLSVLGCSDKQAPTTFTIATGGPAGLYYPFGGGMASIWSKQLPHVNAKAEVTGGSVTNVIQVARKESELGIAMADVVTDAYIGQGKFPQALPLRVLFTAYPNIVHILTLQGNDVGGVTDLRGKRVSLGAAGSGTAVAATNVLTGLGVALADIAPVYLSFGETTAALKDGTIDAGFVVGGLGIAAVTELAVTRDLRLVALSNEDLSRLSASYPAYTGYQIPGGTYAKINEDVQALGIWSAVVVHEDMPESLAFELTCTIYKHRETLLKVSPVVKDMTLANLAKVPSVPLHAGSLRFAQAPTQDCRG